MAVAWPADGIGRVVRIVVAGLVMAAASLLIAFATGLVQARVASPTPNVSPSSPVGQVLTYAGSWRGPGVDPLITLPSGAQVKASNYRGVWIGDTTYYYNLAPRASFDPLARGEVTADEVQVVAVVGDAPNRVMVYTLRAASK
ncbi:MAG TPA: hypothetical protein VNL16_10225 [Chloroflexota bacterium]|nr:hypothetical protein [Chloroflexota bacterium]